MGQPGLPSGARAISIEETRNPLLDTECLDLGYTMQNMGLETVSDMMLKLYAAMAKSYPKHKGEPLEKFRPDPEKTLAQQSQREKEEGQGKPKYKESQAERANLQSSLGPYWSQSFSDSEDTDYHTPFWSSYEPGWVIEITDIVEQYPAVLDGKVGT
ncbi:hypothetical protein BDD12DRAFT_810391 [Trichophaea hybrida]|nr:hypothetical protein BDD12DRAFT_810391 [Trichophaea hybrida]